MKIVELESIYDQFVHAIDLYTKECERQAETKAQTELDTKLFNIA